VLKHGGRWRTRVDDAIQQFHSIATAGHRVLDLIDCIQACKDVLHQLAGAPNSMDTDHARAAAKRLGKRYLMRYILLICFRGYLWEWLRGESAVVAGRDVSRFKEWFDHRKELSHLLQHCSV
jgi:hypothetical protein